MNTLKKTPTVTPHSLSERILAFDLARGLAVMFMIIIHVLNFYGAPEVQNGPFGTTIKFIFGWPAASVFIFIMGTFVAYSNNQNLSGGLKRAAALFALGYVLNLFRATIPTWLSLNMGLVTYEQLGPHTPINGLLVVDIFQCAALAYVICILFKHYFTDPKVWLIAAIIIAFGSPLLWDITSGIMPVDQVLKIFWGNKYQGSLFPLFPWLAYPLAGMAFGHWIKHQNNINQAFNQGLFLGIIIVAIGIALILTNREFHLADNMRSGPGLLVALTGGVLIWLWLCQRVVIYIENTSILNSILYPVLKLLYFWSKHITEIYIIHWLCIGWGLMIFGAGKLNLMATITMMISIMIISDLSMRILLKKKDSNVNKKKSTRVEATV